MHSFVLSLVHSILQSVSSNINGSFALVIMMMGLGLNCESVEVGCFLIVTQVDGCLSSE
jgi:hypothetical protein